MADVLFGQAFYLRFDAKQWKAQQPYPPLGTLYAAAVARRHGFDVDLFDAMIAESERDWERTLDRTRPRLAILFEDSFNYLTKMCLLRMRDAAAVMIRHASRRGIPVIVSSSDATDHPDVYLAAGARAVIVGEGEQTMLDVLNAVLSGGD